MHTMVPLVNTEGDNISVAFFVYRILDILQLHAKSDAIENKLLSIDNFYQHLIYICIYHIFYRC